MSALKRLISHPAVWMLLLVAAVAVPVLLKRAPPLPVYTTLPSLALTDQSGAPFTTARLNQRPAIVNFIFTTCPTICPLLTAKMRRLQDATTGSDVQLVSITVDPYNDTPAVLKTYGEKFGADFARWIFVTGPREAVDAAVIQGFKMVLERERPKEKADPDIWEIVHGERFVLVDRLGRIRGYYAAEDEPMERLVRDARRLVTSND